MTQEELYKLTDILNSEVLGNFMHGGEADEVIAQFEDAVEKSGILEKEVPVSDDLEQEIRKYQKEIYDRDTTVMDVARHFANWQRKQVVREIVASVPKTAAQPAPKRRCKNDVVQFEIKSVYGKNLKSEYDWCVENLPLKEERGLFYHVTEFYIITRSQRIIDKVNRHFGSSFSFKNWQYSRIYFID